MMQSAMVSVWVAALCLVLTVSPDRALAQSEQEIPELPADFVFPEFTCRFGGQFPYVVSIRHEFTQTCLQQSNTDWCLGIGQLRESTSVVVL